MFYTLFGLIGAATGVALKIVWDNYVKLKKDVEFEVWKLRVSQIERRLSLFYWPIYLRLQRDNLVWKKILVRFENNSTEEERNLGYQIDKKILLPNHLEMVKIIESNIHLADLDEKLNEALMAYVKHVDVYRSIREIGIRDKDPIAFDVPFPKKLFAMIETKLLQYQSEYDELLRNSSIR